MSSLFALKNDTFASFVFYGSLAIGKTMMMSVLTGHYRFKETCMISVEDAKALAPNDPEKQKRILIPNDTVERNGTFASFVYYGSLVIGKTLMMSVLTGLVRFKTKSMASIEDAKALAPENPEMQKRILSPNEIVERVRSAHRNDLENIVPFAILGLLYVSTEPNPIIALWHFRMFVVFRFLHTLIYVNAIRQPFRFFTFLGGFSVCISMLCRCLVSSHQYW